MCTHGNGDNACDCKDVAVATLGSNMAVMLIHVNVCSVCGVCGCSMHMHGWQCDISQANVTAGVKLPEAGAVDDGGVGVIFFPHSSPDANVAWAYSVAWAHGL